jgi:cytidine deaminase
MTVKTPPKDLLDHACRVLKHAYAPYSHFFVASAVRAPNGDIFAGCNVENASYPIGTCAEAGAISQLIAAGHKSITEILILVRDEKICPPCGGCRQRLIEFAADDLPIHLCTVSGLHEYYTLKDIMPMAFRPDNLEK